MATLIDADTLGEGIAKLIRDHVAKELKERADKIANQAEKIQSFERRFSRFADHTNRLEDRVRTVETGGGK